MNELHDCCKLVMMCSVIATSFRRQYKQGRAQSFAPACYDIIGHLADQHDLRAKALTNDGVDLLQVVSNKAVDVFRTQLRVNTVRKTKQTMVGSVSGACQGDQPLT